MNAQCPYLDFSTVHLYPDNWKIAHANFGAYINQFLQERAAIVAQNNKPMVVEEFGGCLSPEDKGSRQSIFTQYLAAFQKANVAGQLVWQMYPSDHSLMMDPNYDFTPALDPGSAKLISDAAKHFQQ